MTQISRYRPDQRALEEGKFAEAENVKLGLEQAQRDRRRQRDHGQVPEIFLEDVKEFYEMDSLSQNHNRMGYILVFPINIIGSYLPMPTRDIKYVGLYYPMNIHIIVFHEKSLKRTYININYNQKFILVGTLLPTLVLQRMQ